MEQQQIQESDQQSKVLIFHDQHTNSEIEQNLKGLKYYSKLSLSLKLADQTQIDLIAQALSNLNHLKSISITFMRAEIPSNNLLSILKSLQMMNELHELEFYFWNQQNEFMEEMQITLGRVLYYLPKLDSLTTDLAIFNTSSNQSQELFKKSFQNLNSLKQLRLNLNTFDSQDICNTTDIIAHINKLVNITKLSLYMKSNIWQLNIPLDYTFDNLKKITDLEIKFLLLGEADILTVITSIQSLQALKRISLSLPSEVIKGQLTKLFNTIFNLQLLEEFAFSSKIYKKHKLVIGEEVCEGSKLKTLKLQINDQLESNDDGIIVFGNQIKRLKNLEVLSLECDHFFFQQESIRALSEWKCEWKGIKDFRIKNKHQYIKFDESQLIAEIANGFSFARSITKLYLCLDYKGLVTPIDVLNGLSQLKNLESLSCQGLYHPKLENSKKKYMNCFKELLNLKELVLLDISYSEELTCIGESLKYLTELIKFSVNSWDILNFKNFDIFCKNLRFLKKLNSFIFKTENIFVNEFDCMPSDHIQMLLQGILELKAMKSLVLLPEIQEKAQKMFNTEFLILISTPSNIHHIQIPYQLFQNNKSKILRHCKRLVQKQQ